MKIRNEYDSREAILPQRDQGKTPVMEAIGLGIDFGGLMKKEEFDYDWMKLTADAAHNLFSWNSKCAATPFEISRMPAPAIQAIYTSFFIANGDYAVSVRENEDGKKVFVMDDSAGREREKIRQQFDRMLADIGAEMG